MTSKNYARNLRDDRLVFQRMNIEKVCKYACAHKHRDQKQGHPCERGSRIFGFGLLKGLYAIRDCFDSRQRGAAICKRSEQQKQVQRLRVITFGNLKVNVVRNRG